MLTHLFVSLFCLLQNAPALAEPWHITKGSLNDSHQLNTDKSVKTQQSLKVGAQGAIIEKPGVTLMAAAGSQVELPADSEAENLSIRLSEGSLRVKVKPRKKTDSRIQILTRSAVMGVRGTDFLAVYQPLMQESEIVVFKGEVHFASASKPEDAKEITQGYWGGIGGRYGNQVSELIKLPANVIETFRQKSEL